MQFMREPLSVGGGGYMPGSHRVVLLGAAFLIVDFVLETSWRPPVWRLYGDPRYGDFMETPVRLGDLDSLLFFFWTPCPHS